MIFAKHEHEMWFLFILRWIARLSSFVVLTLLALFIFGDDGIDRGISATEAIGLFFFPFGVAAGFVVGWRRELAGGLISLTSLACFYLIFGLGLTGRWPGGIWFAVLTTPGFLLLGYGLLQLVVDHGADENYAHTQER